MKSKILQGDCTELLPTIEPASIQCVATSPPYFSLRDYHIPPTNWPAIEYTPMIGLPSIAIPAMSCCLGLESDPLAYIGHLVHVFRLAWHALRDDGTAWLNLGDSHAQPSKWGGQSNDRTRYPRRRVKPGSGFKDKDLYGIPWRAALAIQADGWYVRNQVIWWKPNAMPESVDDRLTNDYEPIYLLTKSPRYYFDQSAIFEPATSTKNRGGGRKIQNLVAGPGQKNDGFKDRWQPNGTRNLRSVWAIPTQALREEHYAAWPEALIELCIRAGSSARACEHCGAAWARFDPGCTCANNTGSAASVVLDPFAGSGTTLRVAERLQRHSVGIELNSDYIAIQHRRTDGVQIELLV